MGEDEDEWAEIMTFDGFHAHTSTFLVETMERYLTEVLDEYSTRPEPQMRLHSLLHGQTLVGEELVRRWQTRASLYPPELARAIVRENLVFEGFGYGEEMVVARDDVIVLYELICKIERQILGVLLGLNGIYLPNVQFKWIDELIAELQVRPPDLATRLRSAFRLPPLQGIEELHAVIDDIFTLVETHMPDLDTSPYREQMRQRRGPWDHPPEM